MHRPFQVIGISYQKADIDTRGKFSLTPGQTTSLLSQAAAEGLEGVLVLSTCNRTEIYANSNETKRLIDLLCTHSNGDIQSWEKVGWVKKDEEAVNHLLRVGCGLESKILGDFQIIGQIKKSFEQSKELGLANTFLDRLLNACIRNSKRVKNETALCSGSASVAYAAVDFIREWDQSHAIENILLLGAGDIGKATCSNLLKQFPKADLLVTNRSMERAKVLEEQLGVNVIPWENRIEALQKADIVVVATGAPKAILTPDMVTAEKAQLFLDLSVPRNIAPEVGELAMATLFDMDELINHTDQAISQRKAEVPAAEKILAEISTEFLAWVEKRRYSGIINSFKSELATLHEEEINSYKQKNPEVDALHLEKISERMLNKITGRVAKFFHTHHDRLGAEVDIFAEVLGK
jgi:glutamyl-tRNA reductase